MRHFRTLAALIAAATIAVAAQPSASAPRPNYSNPILYADYSDPDVIRVGETYFPSNGSLLLAVGMMAAGWDGSSGHAPGFPKQGWSVKVENIRPLP